MKILKISIWKKKKHPNEYYWSGYSGFDRKTCICSPHIVIFRGSREIQSCGFPLSYYVMAPLLKYIKKIDSDKDFWGPILHTKLRYDQDSVINSVSKWSVLKLDSHNIWLNTWYDVMGHIYTTNAVRCYTEWRLFISVDITNKLFLEKTQHFPEFDTEQTGACAIVSDRWWPEKKRHQH